MSLVPPLLAVVLLAQVPPAEEAARDERLKYMQARAAEFSLLREDSKEPLSLKEEPVVRYSNPERDSGTWDGTTFLWLEGTRPVAAISFGIRRPKDAVFHELTSFSTTLLVCRRGETAVWSPQAGGSPSQLLPDAPSPAESQAARLAQMRALARRFSAACTFKEDTTQLRLLPQPLFRYADEPHVQDGALFALVVSNDPEMFLTLEARRNKEGEKATWHYSLARMSSLKLTAALDEKEVWSVPGYYTIPAGERRTGPYIEGLNGTFVSVLPYPPE